MRPVASAGRFLATRSDLRLDNRARRPMASRLLCSSNATRARSPLPSCGRAPFISGRRRPPILVYANTGKARLHPGLGCAHDQGTCFPQGEIVLTPYSTRARPASSPPRWPGAFHLLLRAPAVVRVHCRMIRGVVRRPVAPLIYALRAYASSGVHRAIGLHQV
jgi:hypothetical protein